MADIVSSLLKINNIEVAPDAPVSEALFAKIGGSINALIDENDDRISEIGDLSDRSAVLTLHGNVTAIWPAEYSIVDKDAGGANHASYLRATPAGGGSPIDYPLDGSAYNNGLFVGPYVFKVLSPVASGSSSTTVRVYSMSTPA